MNFLCVQRGVFYFLTHEHVFFLIFIMSTKSTQTGNESVKNLIRVSIF